MVLIFLLLLLHNTILRNPINWANKPRINLKNNKKTEKLLNYIKGQAFFFYLARLSITSIIRTVGNIHMIASLITYTLLLSPLINPINFVRITLKRAKTHCTTVTISHIHIYPSPVFCLSGNILLYLRFNPTNFGHK